MSKQEEQIGLKTDTRIIVKNYELPSNVRVGDVVSVKRNPVKVYNDLALRAKHNKFMYDMAALFDYEWTACFEYLNLNIKAIKNGLSTSNETETGNSLLNQSS